MSRKGKRIEKIIANRYRKAGYNVKENAIKKFNQYRKMEIDIVARKGNEKLIIEVKGGKQTITSSDILKLHKKSNKTRGKPVLAITENVKLTNNAKRLAKYLGIKIKRIKLRK